MKEEKISYSSGSTKMIGSLYLPNTQIKSPVVIVAPAFRGKDDFAREKAQLIVSRLGCAAFALDYYGDEKQVSTDAEAQELMIPLFKDRKELRSRANAAFEVLREDKRIDSSRMGAIGFCFGGLVALELFKSGAPLKGIVTFHGLLGNDLGEIKASPEPLAQGIKGSILVLTGDEDPLVPDEHLYLFRKQMTKAGIDWEVDIYGHAVHAFTNPKFHEKNSGLAYEGKACFRAFERMFAFFKTQFEL